MKNIRKLLVAISFIMALLVMSSSSYAAPDVYLVYSGGDKSIQKEIKNALPSNIKVKGYNVDLLAIADYSGKQKATSKLSKAKLIVFINEKPSEILEGIEFENLIKIKGIDDLDSILEKLN